MAVSAAAAQAEAWRDAARSACGETKAMERPRRSGEVVRTTDQGDETQREGDRRSVTAQKKD